MTAVDKAAGLKAIAFSNITAKSFCIYYIIYIIFILYIIFIILYLFLFNIYIAFIV